ncbi:hypothetical protein AG0111_0g6870 [Alternaria gaisen]|uniref:Uncharacterized protein n=1 Tax=Alternaria gaisen TaxID=167740 RepID=A0ACB6FKS7_9PLEO|nr:hypothetical protein AG0111_0g6870 [Alternaria gaisen]
MPPKNISTGAYWKEDPTDAPHRDVETDSETGESSESEPPTSHKKVTISDDLEDNLVTQKLVKMLGNGASDIDAKETRKDDEDDGENRSEGKGKGKKV